MKTIGTITFHESNNYGALLQTYALQRSLTEMGFRSEIIDYRNPERGISHLPNHRRVLHSLWHKGFKELLTGPGRKEKTEAFRKKYLALSSGIITNPQALHSNPPLYDAYITGSDQVWNPSNNSRDSSFFLTFAPLGRKRISYAASFGLSRIPEKVEVDYANWLKGIDFLSVREQEGKEIVALLTGREAEVVLDPTLLLNENQWQQIAIPHEHEKPYILCYYMPGDKKVNAEISSLARHIAKLTGWDIISIGQKEYMRLCPFKTSIFDAGPAEFLGLIQNAAFVLTNSFHGVAFSINYKKPFFSPINQELDPGKALSSRITSLLSTLGLEERLVPTGSSGPSKTNFNLDYKPVEEKLEREKTRSLDFLRHALEEA